MQDRSYNNQYYEKPRKKRIGLIIFLVFFFILILPLVITGSIIIAMYKNVKAPDKIKHYNFDAVNQSITSLNNFIKESGAKEYSLSIDEQMINKTIFNEVYKKSAMFNNTANFQEDSKEYNNLIMHQNMGRLSYGSSGAWIKFISDDTILLYGGLNLTSPLSFKTGVYIYLKYKKAPTPEEDDSITLHKLYIGNLIIVKSLMRYTLKQVFKKMPDLKARFDELNKSDLYKVDLDKFMVSFNRNKVINHLLDKAQSSGKKQELVEILTKQVKDNKFIALDFDKQKVNLKLGLNQLASTEEYIEQELSFNKLRAIDIFREYKEDILLNFTNFSSLDKTSVAVKEETAKKLFRYILSSNGMADSPIFKDGFQITYKDTLNKEYKYDLKFSLPQVDSISNGDISLSLEARLTYKEGENIYQVRSRINMSVSLALTKNAKNETNLKVIIKAFKFADFLNLDNEDKLKPIFKTVKEKFNIKELNGNSFTFDYSFDRFEKELGVEISDLKYQDNKIIVVFGFRGKLKEEIENIKNSLQNILKLFTREGGPYSDYFSQGLDLLSLNANNIIEQIKNNTLDSNTKEILNKYNIDENIIKEKIGENEESAKNLLDNLMHDEKNKAITNLEKQMKDNKFDALKNDLFLQSTLKASNDIKSVLGFK